MCDDVSKKVCSKCGIEKELGEFTFVKSKNRYEYRCKICVKEYNSKYNKDKQAGIKRIHKYRKIEDSDIKICTKCCIEKPLNEFSFSKSKNKHENWCKACINKYGHNYYLKNRGKDKKRRHSSKERPDSRFCTKCKQYKLFNEFRLNKNNLYDSMCKNCCWQYYLEHEGKNKNRKVKKQYIDIKPCSCCKEIKPIDCFVFLKKEQQYNSQCKSCGEKRQKEWQANNRIKSKENFSIDVLSTKICIGCNLEKNILQFSFLINRNRHDNCCKECKNLNNKNYKKSNQYKEKQNKKRRENPAIRIRSYLSSVILLFLIKNHSSKNGKSCLEFLPYLIEELKTYIESLFEWWMTWDNWGQYRVNKWDDNDPSTWTWQIDHIIPHSFFKYTSMDSEEFRQCWALENLRPLSAKENLLKRDKIDKDVFDKLYPILVERAKNV